AGVGIVSMALVVGAELRSRADRRCSWRIRHAARLRPAAVLGIARTPEDANVLDVRVVDLPDPPKGVAVIVVAPVGVTADMLCGVVVRTGPELAVLVGPGHARVRVRPVVVVIVHRRRRYSQKLWMSREG